MELRREDLPRSYVVVDIETTGLDVQRDQMCEIAAVKVTDGTISGAWSTLVAIQGPMPPAARKVHGITDGMLVGSPAAKEAVGELARFIGPGCALAGHNIKRFDLPFIERVAQESKVDFSYGEAIDTLELARELWPGKKHSMDSLRRMLGIKSAGAHRALKDCMDELELLLIIKATLNGKE